MSITTVGNHLIHYEVLGRGQPVVFVHGWLGSWRYWWPTMQALASHHRSFAIDFWGFGDSSKEKSRYSLDDYAEMLEAFRDKLGIMRPMHLVGHAMGAAAALKYTRKYPEQVNKLTAVSLPVHGTYVNARLTNTGPDDFVSRVLGKSNSFTEIDSELRKTDPLAMNTLAQELVDSELLDDVANCPRPLLLIYGGQDEVVLPPTGEHDYLQRSGNNRYYVSLDNCHHFPMLQERNKFNRLLLDFLLTDEEELTELIPKEYWQRRVR